MISFILEHNKALVVARSPIAADRKEIDAERRRHHNAIETSLLHPSGPDEGL